MSLIKDITAGHPKKLAKPVLLTLLANILNIIPFVLVIEAVRIIFKAFSRAGEPLDVTGLWWLSGFMLAYTMVVFWGERLAYRACYRGAYIVAADGRAELAEYLRKLPLGFLFGRDPGDLANMLMGDFALLEQNISHVLPQLVGALVMPVLALVGLGFLNWQMALAMFSPLVAALLVLAGTKGIMDALGSRHMRAKINAGNRLQEYLQGIRVIKAHNLTGVRFERLEKSFRELMRESIRLEGFIGPIVLLAIALARSGLTVLVIAGVYLLVGGRLDPLVFVTFLIIGTRVFDPLTTALVGFAELRYASQAGGRILNLLGEPRMSGVHTPPESCEIKFKNVRFGYQEIQVLKDVSAVMEQGSLTALVGPSGSGQKHCPEAYCPFLRRRRRADTVGRPGRQAYGPRSLARKGFHGLSGRVPLPGHYCQ